MQRLVGSLLQSNLRRAFSRILPRLFSTQVFLDPSDVEKRVMQVVKNFDAVDESLVKKDSHFANDLGLDSLNVVELILAVEEEFAIEIPDAEAEKILSIPEAVKLIAAHPQANRRPAVAPPARLPVLRPPWSIRFRRAPLLPTRLHESHYLPEIGLTLSVEEKAGLELAENRLKNEVGREKLYLWGRVSGKESDYFIAYTLQKPDFARMPVFFFYYCTTRHYEWIPFPVLDAWQRQKAESFSGSLKGTPQLLIEEREPTEEEQEAARLKEEAAAEAGLEIEEVKPVQFQEAHGLVVMVERMVRDLSVVPKGAYTTDATHDIVPNGGYQGLSNREAGDLHNYFHFRDTEDSHRQLLLEKAGLVAPEAFLDPLAEDLPRGVWTLTFNATRTVVLLRNLKWPGYHFFHAIGTGHFGGVYFGNGKEERDLVFMV